MAFFAIAPAIARLARKIVEIAGRIGDNAQARKGEKTFAALRSSGPGREQKKGQGRMKPLSVIAMFGVMTLISTASGEAAGKIERACLQSDRPAASRALCGCIQDAADLTLTNSDQKMVARFFRDPHMAQEIRQSDRRSHEKFWQRYKNFGATAQAFCRR